VRDNLRAAGSSDGVVIGTEYEPKKARAAHANFNEAGLGRFIDLREGDLRKTLRQIDDPVDFILVDIWIPMSLPALELVARICVQERSWCATTPNSTGPEWLAQPADRCTSRSLCCENRRTCTQRLGVRIEIMNDRIARVVPPSRQEFRMNAG
jgi:hypothetical protein